ncbi:MAG: acylphosphatase [Actinomycetes bacterium]
MNAGVARAVVWVGGQVQGVGFRWWVSRRAGELRLAGHVENLWDGRVRIDAQGHPDAVDALVGMATQQPAPPDRPGRVTSTLVERRDPDPDVVGFDVR